MKIQAMLIGREEEQYRIRKAYEDEYSQFVVVYGRRRVGKTFLVRETFDDSFCFQHSGLLGEKSCRKQLEAFRISLKDYGHVCDTPRNWLEAFDELKEVIKSSSEGKKVIFIDEIASMDTGKSGFVPALEHFWNGWCSSRKDILLVICSSATSWIIRKVFRNKGGLHNRVAAKIHVHPFTLGECEQFLHYKGITWSRYQILSMYMVLGGVAYYWSLLDRRLSPSQNIDQLFFYPDAELSDEFSELYSSLFKNPEPYIKIISALGGKAEGLTRSKIAEIDGLDDSGTLTNKLEDLERCEVVGAYPSYPNKKKGSIYKLMDSYSLFYLRCIASSNSADKDFWSHSQSLPFAISWSGPAFEIVCLQHIDKIKESLGISGVLTREWMWMGDDSQIDLMIERMDKVVNICIMKWSQDAYDMTREDHRHLISHIEEMSKSVGPKTSIQVTMITVQGVKLGAYSDDYQTEVLADALFR